MSLSCPDNCTDPFTTQDREAVVPPSVHGRWAISSHLDAQRRWHAATNNVDGAGGLCPHSCPASCPTLKLMEGSKAQGEVHRGPV